MDHPVFAAVYDVVSRAADAAGLEDRRRRLLAGARGRVLEVGGGTGLNLSHYSPDTVESLVVVEPDASMRRRLLDRLPSAPVPVQVHEATLEDAVAARSLAEGAFDTVVCTLVLCTVPDQVAALGVIRRLLAPGGRLLFLEHVRAPGAVGTFQATVTPVWRRLAAGCHLDRDTVHAIRKAGFVITDCERFHSSRLDPCTGAMAQGTARARTREEGA